MKQTNKDTLELQVLEVAYAAVGELRPLVGRIARHDGDLAKQIRRAANSVTLNTGEGCERSGRDRGHLLRVASGSAREIRVALKTAAAWGYIQGEQARGADELLDRVCAMLYRLRG